RALRRTAAARRDRSRAREPAHDRLRGRADRQPRLEDERGDPRPHARLRRRARPDDRDGHPRRARGGDRRPHPFPGRRGGRARRRTLRLAHRARDHGRARGLMLRVTLKGLAGRKTRAVLTGLAIVLGVAMMSGTFVLTDTINNAFTSIFTESYKNADAVIS